MGPLSTWSSPKGPEWRPLVGDTGNRSCLRGSFFRSWTHLRQHWGGSLRLLGGRQRWRRSGPGVLGSAFAGGVFAGAFGGSGGGLVVGGGNGGGCCHPLSGKGGGFGPVTTAAVEPVAWGRPSLPVAGGFISVLWRARGGLTGGSSAVQPWPLSLLLCNRSDSVVNPTWDIESPGDTSSLTTDSGSYPPRGVSITPPRVK